MKSAVYLLGLFLFITLELSAQSRLKWVIYDFDGLNTGQTDLPDGDYKSGDLTYQVAANPFGNSDMLGDRVLQMDLNWAGGSGTFGKACKRFIELDPASDYINFYFYNPTANKQSVVVKVQLGDDDNGDNVYNSADDDLWQMNATISGSEGWQLISLPLNQFTDGSSGGNGAFDLGYTGAGGMLMSVAFQFNKANSGLSHEQYFIDMISFSEGALPHGSSIFDLPGKDPKDYCYVGAYSIKSESNPDQVPAEIEGIFNDGKKIRYVNWFMAFSENSTPAPNKLPGAEVSNLLNGGYRPIITWEPLYNNWARLDPVQPRLNDLISGKFDSYYDSFGDKLKSYGDTVIVRFMHEFEGNWYPWSLTENGQDPSLYIKTFKYVVDRVRARGATKVKWMWCLNAEPAPYSRYNWVMSAYPGDDYVDIVATDIYNHPNLGIPDWKSFRYTGIESYYYLTKYLPQKPLYICEVASRERDASEPVGSQTKAEWEKQMNKEVQSFFSKSRALIFFSAVKEHDWRINSSQASTDEIRSDVWNDSYYWNGTPILAINPVSNDLNSAEVYPNPFNSEIQIISKSPSERVEISDLTGRKVLSTQHVNTETINVSFLPAGIYILKLQNDIESRVFKIIKKS